MAPPPAAPAGAPPASATPADAIGKTLGKMGSNYAEAGYDSVEAFVDDMRTSEAYQLDAFVAFIQNAGIQKALDSEDWHSFAYRYNGPGQVEVYAEQIAKAAANGEVELPTHL